MSPLLLLLPLTALAQEPVQTTGDLRWIGTSTSDFAVDAEGHRFGQGPVLDQRIRLGLWAQAGLAKWEAEADLLTGQIAGDPWDVPGTIDARRRWEVLPWGGPGGLRKLNVETYAGDVQLKVGLQTSHWGLGLLANDGAHDPFFGRADFGDRVVRARATLMPSGPGVRREALLLTMALDVVMNDEIGAWRDGQRAVQGIFSALWLGPQDRKAGFYTVFRAQRELVTERTTHAFISDGYVDWALPLGAWDVRLAAEGASIIGRTDRFTTYASPEAIAVLQGGAAGIATLSDPSQDLQVHLRSGIASGDADLDDGRTSDFAFDRDFNVGMVLFDQVQGAIEAATYALLDDPTLAYKAPDGADALVTEGSFRHAAFVQPIAEQRFFDLVTVKAGTVFAWNTSPVAHPYYTFRAGGSPRNHLDRPTEGRYLGTEVNWGVAFHRETSVLGSGPLHPSFDVQGGHAFLGAPLLGDQTTAVHSVQARARLRW